MCEQTDAERLGASRDVEQVEQTEDGGDQGTDDPDADGPPGAPGQRARPVGRARTDVEHDARDPGPDRHGDEDRVERMPVRARRRR